MIKFYILLPNDTIEDLEKNERNYLGAISFETFTPGSGYKILNYIIEKRPDLLEKIRIKNGMNKDFTVESFLSELTKCKRIKPIL